MMWLILSVFLSLAHAQLAVITITRGTAKATTILDRHNAERQRTVAGVVNGLPTASANPDLTYSNDLAALAAIEVGRMVNGQCYQGHHPDGPANDPARTGANSVGENIAYFGADDVPLKDQMAGWVDEQNCYTFGTFSGTDQCSSVGNCQCGHYTQVIWAATSQVGCAYTTNCPNWFKTKLLCLYRQAGNYRGQEPFSCAESGCPINNIPAPALPTCLEVTGMCCGLGGDYTLLNTVANGKQYYENAGGYKIVWTGTNWALKQGTSGGYYATCVNNALVPSDCEWYDTNGFPTAVSVPAGCEVSSATTTAAPTTTVSPAGCVRARGFAKPKALNGVYSPTGNGNYEMVKGKSTYILKSGKPFVYQFSRKNGEQKKATCASGTSWDTCTKWKKNANARFESTACVSDIGDFDDWDNEELITYPDDRIDDDAKLTVNMEEHMNYAGNMKIFGGMFVVGVVGAMVWQMRSCGGKLGGHSYESIADASEEKV